MTGHEEDTCVADKSHNITDQLEELTAKLNETPHKLAQIEKDNAALRKENASFTTAWRTMTKTGSRFRVQVNSMQNLDSTLRFGADGRTPLEIDGELHTPHHEHNKNYHNTRKIEQLSNGENLTQHGGSFSSRMMGSEHEPIIKSADMLYLEAMFSKIFGEIEAMFGRLPGVAPSIRKSTLH
ncbi:hypothetical protein V5N11_029257 [Cardamine amara subsp. amara]|uniref:Uncharacterized protein n=1 Tax=Cardamine amara subsp. amara TaxID=228776 RepID=A0ABD1BQZ5_CARAN